MVEDAVGLGVSAVDSLTGTVTGEDTNFSKEIVKNAKRYMPGNNVWFLRLMLERYIWDDLELLQIQRLLESARSTSARLRLNVVKIIGGRRAIKHLHSNNRANNSYCDLIIMGDHQ